MFYLALSHMDTGHLTSQQASAPVFTPISPLMSPIPEARGLSGMSHLTEELLVLSWRFKGNLFKVPHKDMIAKYKTWDSDSQASS